MSEGTMWQRVSQAFKVPCCDVTRVENPANPGTPDVNYCLNSLEGWMELKWARDWPKRPNTPMRFEHYTNEQKIWLTDRARAGGRVYIFAKVADDWLLYNVSNNLSLIQVFGTLTRSKMFQHATRHWHRGLNNTELISELKG